MEPKERLIFALDVPGLTEAKRYIEVLRDHVGAFKVGLELFSAVGPGILRDPVIRKVPILLDLKLHDIPETVRRTARQFTDFSILGITAHAAGGKEMFEAATSTGVPIYGYGVTVLTSIEKRNLEDEGIDMAPQLLVSYRARIAQEAGCAGIIASPWELAMLQQYKSENLELVTPGIRPMGKNKDDQKRTSTPRNAIGAGATRLVVGRPIRDDKNPAAAADRIVKEIEQGMIAR